MRAVSCWIAMLSLLALPPYVSAANSVKDVLELAVVRYEQDDYERANPHLNEATAHDPFFAEAYKYLKRSLLKMERWLEAVERLTRPYDLMPEAQERVFWVEFWDSVVKGFITLLDDGEMERA